MRAWVGFVATLLACAGAPTQAPIDPDGRPGKAQPECQLDDDCVAAGSTCCDCPTFAVPTFDEIHQACVDVVCPSTECSDNVQVACSRGRCVLACVAIVCEQTCANGFATDPNGCLTCACAPRVVDGCTDVGDCVRVRADCCGCEHGGRDTAVLRRDARSFETTLMCEARPLCPAVAATCDAQSSLECVQGRCELSTGGALPTNACGRPDLAPCPAGQVCVINGADSPTNQQGLGLCGLPEA